MLDGAEGKKGRLKSILVCERKLSGDILQALEDLILEGCETPTIHLMTLVAMRLGKAIKSFYKVTWHKNTGRGEILLGTISPKRRKPFSHTLFLAPMFDLVLLRVCLSKNKPVDFTWDFPCLFEAAWWLELFGEPLPVCHHPCPFIHNLGRSGTEEGIMAPSDPGGAHT